MVLMSTAFVLPIIGSIRRGPLLGSPQVNGDNQSGLLYLEFVYLFLFRMRDATSLIIRTGMKHACEACVVLYLAQGSYNIGTLDLACLHYIVTTHCATSGTI